MSNNRAGWNAFKRSVEKSDKARGPGRSRSIWQKYLYAMEIGESGGIRILFPGKDGFYVRKTHGWPKETCTSEHPLFGGKCVWCYYNERSDEFRDKYYPSVSHIIEMIDFRYLHYDTSGDRPLQFPCQDLEPLPKRSRCRHCHSTDPGVKERHFGGRKRWEVSGPLFLQILEVNNKLGTVCIAQTDKDDPSSICGENVIALGFNCANPECGVEVISERDLQTEDVSGMLSEKYECGECGESDWLVPVLMCESQDHEPVVGTVFDRLLEVSCSGRDYTVKGGKDRGKTKTRKAYNFDRNVSEWSTVVEDLQAFGCKDEEIEEMLKQDDLEKRFAPFRIKMEDFGSEEEYVVAVLKKQAESCKMDLPEGWGDLGGAQKSTGGSPWARRRGGNR